MAASLTKLSNAEYTLQDVREPLAGDGAIHEYNPAAYYTAEGNPPGRWIGSACRHVGGVEGQEATSDTVRRLINERRDPSTGRFLGERDLDKSDNGQAPVTGWDLTLTVPKSVSVLWAFSDAQTRKGIDECLDKAASMTIEYLEREYVSTRSGQGGVASAKCDGVMGFVFDHYDSRDGDPHPHKHIVISNRVRREDGVWTAIDGRHLYSSTVEVSELHTALVRDLLTQRFGWNWTAKSTDSRAVLNEIDGVPTEVIELFSGRDTEITHRLDQAIQQEEMATGMPVGPRRRAELHRDIWLATRHAKPETQPSLAEKRASWKARLSENLPGFDPDRMLETVRSRSGEPMAIDQRAGESIARLLDIQLADHSIDTGTQKSDEWTEKEIDALADQAIERVADVRTTWTRSNIRAEAHRLLGRIQLDPQTRAGTANMIADRAIERCVRLTPTRYRAPEGTDAADLVMDDGRVVYDDARLDRYTTRGILDAEARVMAMFDHDDTHGYAHGKGREWLERWVSQGHGRLAPDQMDAAAYAIENPRAASAIIGAAGTGKTTTMKAVAGAWRDLNGDDTVLGLATSRQATRELRESIGCRSMTIAKLLVGNDPDRIRERQANRNRILALADTTTDPNRRDEYRRRLAAIDAEESTYRLHAGQLVIIDEAGMVDTRLIARIADMAERAGARILMTGDPKQLDSVSGAGGLLGWAEREGRCARLTSVWRFVGGNPDQAWRWDQDPDGRDSIRRWAGEAQATLRLRQGGDRLDGNSVDECERLVGEYADHDRLHWGEDTQVEEDAYRQCMDWQRMGKTTLLIAGTNGQVRDMNQRFILERRVAELSDADPDRLALLRDGLEVGAGDQIVCRRNDWRIRKDGDQIENGMLFRIGRVDRDSIAAVRIDDGREWTIPRTFLAESCEAGYAATVHRCQGMTVDRCAAVFPSDANVQNNLQYVAATRGREENHLYYACKDEDQRLADQQLYGTDPDPEKIARQRMLGSLLNRPDTLTATETGEREHRDRTDLKRLLREHDHAAGMITGPHLKAMLHRTKTPEEVTRIERSPDWEWLRGVWSRAWMTDPRRALAIIGRDLPKPDEGKHAANPAALLAARLNTGLLDRENGAVHDDWIGGVVPPIRASRHDGVLDVVRQNERLIEQAADRLEHDARDRSQAWTRRIAGRLDDDPRLMRDIAVYRAMWGVTDPDDPIGPRPAAVSGRAEQHWANLDARITGTGTGVVNPAHARHTTTGTQTDWPTPATDHVEQPNQERSTPEWNGSPDRSNRPQPGLSR